MIDEEKAEEYYYDKYHVTLNIGEEYRYEAITSAFCTGLAEGRKEKWHDLRKDPNDLPKEGGGYLILHEDNTGFTHYSVRDFRHGYFECTNTIIAWCELPKFKE